SVEIALVVIPEGIARIGVNSS
ncbi:hypothetical protein A2U01_0074012, partial [Trifolium medium]|nr:hypothetical protein [Trifolium medium]